MFTCWSDAVLGNHEQILPECEDHDPAEECDTRGEAHEREDGHILAVVQLQRRGCTKQDDVHDQNLRKSQVSSYYGSVDTSMED